MIIISFRMDSADGVSDIDEEKGLMFFAVDFGADSFVYGVNLLSGALLPPIATGARTIDT